MKEKQLSSFTLDEKRGYFHLHGVDVMAFDDIYPAGHQGGVGMIMHGQRVAANGDVRLEPTPGQWQPLPRMEKREMDREHQTITASLHYPDPEQHLKGFNPMLYPDLMLDYQVKVQPVGEGIQIQVNLSQPIDEKYAGKVCFNLELFPASLFGKPWIMDRKHGIFPAQPNGPVMKMPSNFDYTNLWEEPVGPAAHREELAGDPYNFSPIIADDWIGMPYCRGKMLTVRPDEPLSRFTIQSESGMLCLFDGRMNHNNGWFVVSEAIQPGQTENAVRWLILPSVCPAWRYTSVIQLSQVGYLPGQPKIACIELDERETEFEPVRLYRIGTHERILVEQRQGHVWGRFLRYQYLQYDFSWVRQSGLYQICYGDQQSSVFRIDKEVLDRGVWQPVLEYFLPVQMCHMRVSEKYRVWHDRCHMDDAAMAPLNRNHFDGYVQGASTLTKWHSGQHVPGLCRGGWHDAGDFDLRVESQAGEMYLLSLVYDAFRLHYDATTIDQKRKITEIHQPDGENDLLQQIEHGALSVIGGYRALGRLYRGIICRDLRQYVLLGDAAAMTDGISGNEDDRWVFTEDNPPRELTVAAHLAASAVALRGFRDALSKEALDIAMELYSNTKKDIPHCQGPSLQAAIELMIATQDHEFEEAVRLQAAALPMQLFSKMAWLLARAALYMKDPAFTQSLRERMASYAVELDKQSRETPYGIPYRPHIWGGGWEIQRLGFQHYYLHLAFPDLFSRDLLFRALDFVLGCHPGSNTASFASGVGAKSATVAYGMNRADFSYIPGGVISGTALIRPDFPELLSWPFLWQQTEYVMGGGSSHFLFLVLAARQLLMQDNEKNENDT